MELKRAYIGIGANLGNRRRNCLMALELLKEQPEIELGAISKFYETEPVEVSSTLFFVNAVAEVKTSLTPHALLDLLLKTEQKLGRDRSRGPDREIDLDLLYYEGAETDEGNLILPHPRISERRFVLAPWAEIAPDLAIPTLKKTVLMLLNELPKNGPSIMVLELGAWR